VMTFSITMSNPVSMNAAIAHDVTWSDPIPANMVYVPGSFAVGACTSVLPVLDDSGAISAAGYVDIHPAGPELHADLPGNDRLHRVARPDADQYSPDTLDQLAGYRVGSLCIQWQLR